VVEVQLAIDRDKLWSWPFYQASAAARFKCDACVVVVTVSAVVEAWAALPVAQGPGGSVFRAVVLGPSAMQLVPVNDMEIAPELAVLSALCHGEREPARVLTAVVAMGKLEERTASAYFDLLRYHLGDALEAVMATSEHKYLSDFARRYYGEGKAEGKAEGVREALLKVMDARGLSPSDEDRARVSACGDLAALEAWLTRAAQAATARDVFGE
jgi:hypothetical protein